MSEMEKVRNAEVECLRKEIAKKDERIKELEEQLSGCDAEEPYDRWLQETKEKTK